MQSQLQSSLDLAVSPSSSHSTREDALIDLEKLIAHLAINQSKQPDLQQFLRLQDTFQCNVPSRLITWISWQSHSFSRQSGSGISSDTDFLYSHLIPQITQALSLIQGVSLIHTASKEFLGGEYCIQILVDLLHSTRHLLTKPFADSTNQPGLNGKKPTNASVQLPAAVLDTLLCILVDSPSALRSFEQASGVEVVVKLLKRAAIPRDIRIKCLEFLYFYLLDETTMGTISSIPATAPSSTNNSPVPIARSWSASPSFSSGPSGSSSTSSRKHPISASASLPYPPVSPIKPKPRPLVMLQREVDFVPLSPKKPSGGFKQNIKPVEPIRLHMSGNKNRMDSIVSDDDWLSDTTTNSQFTTVEHSSFSSSKGSIRTTEEKKEILGQLMGNVDALVEGVKKAGIWGLGG